MKIIRNYFLIAILVGAILVIFELPRTDKIAPTTQKMGDRLQVVLPLAGLVCALDLKEAGSYVTRYVGTLASVHALRNALPQSGINLRPSGNGHGFPSAHTASAAYGASYIARQCASKVPYVGPVVVLAAGFTGLSRVDANKHDPWQVLFGAIFALVFDRAFQSPASRARRNARLNAIKNRFIKSKK